MPAKNIVPARELLLIALAQATEPLTVTELAEEAGVGRSTVSKYLPALEKEELAVRTPGGREGRRRLPDHWQAASAPATPIEQDPPAEGAASLAGEDPDATAEATPCEQAEEHSAPAEDGVTAPETAIEVSVPDPAHPDTQETPGSGPDASPAPATPAPNSARPAPRTSAAPVQDGTRASEEGVNPVSGSRRLEPGELKLMVWALLKADPGAEFTATELSHTLQGRSIGAIQNNLAKLAKEGKAELTCDKPRRYRVATQTA
ncbi:helix-turn-helix domain-containing protein [Nocardiopsis terrae]